MFESESFDLRDESRTRVISGDNMGGIEQYEGEAPPTHVLDGDDAMNLHTILMGHYQRELDRQEASRIEQAEDEDYYDNIQWSEDERQELQERGQAPLTYNVISQSVNWVIGSEKRGRSDFNVLPRGKEDSKPAERKTQLLKYLSDVNNTPFHRSRAFEDAVKVGVGWLEDAVTDGDDGEPIYSRYESWRNMLWDSASTEYDLSDSRYVIRSKWVDVDIAIAMFPERAEVIERAAQDGEDMGYDMTSGDEVMDFAENERETIGGHHDSISAVRRGRVRMIEIWYRKPERVQKVIGSQFNGEVFDQDDQAMGEAVQAGKGVVAERMMLRMNVAVMTVAGMLYQSISPYKHNKFPFTPIWGYRRGRDGLPYGLIRGLKDIQQDINKRASKALFILSSNKVIMEEGAVSDMQEFLEEVARPDGVIQVRPNKRFEINADRELSAAHLDLMARSIQMIQQVSGVTDEQMGRTTNAKSGVAIQARQEQGAMSTAKLFDNMRLANQLQGEKQLSLVEQYFTDEKQFRITNSRGTPDYITVNDGLPDNDIVRSKADFVISDAEWRASLRQAQTEQLLEMMTRLPPEVGMVMLDLIVETMDVPNREELVKRIRQVTGMRDPDATEPTPEEQQAQQNQQAQQQFQQQMAQADLRGKQAKAARDEAEVQAKAMDMQVKAANLVNTNVKTQRDAVETASVAATVRGILPVADGILAEAGFIPVPQQRAMMAQQQQAQAEQQAMQQQAAQQQQMEQQAMQQQDPGMQQQEQPQPTGV